MMVLPGLQKPEVPCMLASKQGVAPGHPAPLMAAVALPWEVAQAQGWVEAPGHPAPMVAAVVLPCAVDRAQGWVKGPGHPAPLVAAVVLPWAVAQAQKGVKLQDPAIFSALRT